ncbi:SDR family oxidoreductase [Paenibacillus sepulcri]
MANVIAPGKTETDASAHIPETKQMKQALVNMTPLGRIAQPEDVGNVISFFAGEASGFVTGSYTPVNGGMLME